MAKKENIKQEVEQKLASSPDVSLLKRLMDDKNEENIILFDDDGKEVELEQVAVVTDEGETYAVLHAVGDPDEEVLVFRIDPTDEESLTMVEDDELGNKILRFVMENTEEEN